MDPFFGSVDLPSSLHKYVYAAASPLFYHDPTGLSFIATMLATLSSVNTRLRDAQISLHTFVTFQALKHPTAAMIVTYASASLNVYSMITDPHGYLACGPSNLADDVYLVASASSRFGNQAFAIIKDADHLARPTGMIGRFTALSVNSTLGGKAGVDPTGWEEIGQLISHPLERNRGHLLPRWFGGKGTAGWQQNFISIFRNTNEEMLRNETIVANALESGDYSEVWYRVTPLYQGDSLIPHAIEMEAVGLDGTGTQSAIFYETILNRRN